MAKSRIRPPRSKGLRGKGEGGPGRDITFQLSGDGVALSLEPVRNPIPRGTFGSIGHFYRVSSDRPFSAAPILIPYESRKARHVDESTLSLFRWDEVRRSLVLVPDSEVNVNQRHVFGRISSSGIYGLIGLPKDERVLRTIALINAIDPAEFRNDKALLPKVCGLILCARGPAGGPVGGNLCDLCLGLEIPQLGLPEGQLVGKHFPGGYIPPPPAPVPKGAPWPMYGHDPRHTGRSAYSGPAAQPAVVWKFTPPVSSFPQPLLSHPVVDENGVVYIGAIGEFPKPHSVQHVSIWALDGATGVTKGSRGWFGPPTAVFWPPQPAVGPDGTIHVSIGEFLLAFDAYGNGKGTIGLLNTAWHWIPQSPLPAADGTVYLFNWRHVPGAPENGLFALNPALGTSNWTSPFDTGAGGLLPIAVRDDHSIIVAGPHIWALAPNKTVQWQHTLSGMMVLEGSPAVADDGTVYVGVRPFPLTTASLRALTANGAAKANWTAPPWGLTTPAVAADGTVYIGFQDNGYPWGGARLDARNADGSLKWSRAIPGGVLEAPAIGGDGTIYFASGTPQPLGSTGATVYALDPATGLDQWTLPLGQSTWSNRSPAIGLNKRLYIVDTSTGTLYALK